MYNGPNGKHFIMVFEILGVNLLEIMKRYDYKGIPMPLVRKMSKQILMGLDYLHRICKIIHTDLKPENVIISLTKEELSELLADGRCIGDLVDEWTRPDIVRGKGVAVSQRKVQYLE